MLNRCQRPTNVIEAIGTFDVTPEWRRHWPNLLEWHRPVCVCTYVCVCLLCVAGQEVVRVNYLGRKVTDWSIYLSFIGFSSPFIADLSCIASLQSSIINRLWIARVVSDWVSVCVCLVFCVVGHVCTKHIMILQKHDNLPADKRRFVEVKLRNRKPSWNWLLRLHLILSLNSP